MTRLLRRLVEDDIPRSSERLPWRCRLACNKKTRSRARRKTGPRRHWSGELTAALHKTEKARRGKVGLPLGPQKIDRAGFAISGSFVGLKRTPEHTWRPRFLPGRRQRSASNKNATERLKKIVDTRLLIWRNAFRVGTGNVMSKMRQAIRTARMTQHNNQWIEYAKTVENQFTLATVSCRLPMPRLIKGLVEFASFCVTLHGCDTPIASQVTVG
jgi:hypothetical protein